MQKAVTLPILLLLLLLLLLANDLLGKRVETFNEGLVLKFSVQTNRVRHFQLSNDDF